MEVVNSVLQKNGINGKTDEQIRLGVGFGVEYLLRSLSVPEHLNPKLSHQVSLGYSELENSKAYLYPGVREMINRISLFGVHILVLSNKPQKGLENSVATHLSFANFLDIKGSLPGSPAKPSPDTLLKMLNDLDIATESCLMIGDGEADVQVSRAVGIDCLSVLWGFRSRDTLEKTGAKLFAESPCDVVNFVLQREQ